MLDQKSIETYKSIHLPRDLRADILLRHTEKSRHHSPQKWLRPAMAFCSLVLIMTVLITTIIQTGGVYVDGVKLGTTPRTVQPASVTYIGGVMRASLDPLIADTPQTAECCIPLSLQFGKDVYLVVHNGSLLLTNADGDAVFTGQAGEVKDGTDAFWVVTGCDTTTPLSATVYSMEGKRLLSLTLTYDATDGIWLIAKNLSGK